MKRDGASMEGQGSNLPPRMRCRLGAGLVLALASRTAAAADNVPSRAGGAGDELSPVTQATFERLVASFEALGVLSDRWGLGLEVAATPRDSIHLYPWYVVGESTGYPKLGSCFMDDLCKTPSYDVQTRALGLDLQYRRYFGRQRGARGFFVAPGFEVSRFITHKVACRRHTNPRNEYDSSIRCDAPVRDAWEYVGPSLDLGGQAITPIGLTVGASVGVHYRVPVPGDIEDEEMPFGWSISHGPGLRPRLRLWVGWAFL